jgi:hypothetical protein
MTRMMPSPMADSRNPTMNKEIYRTMTMKKRKKMLEVSTSQLTSMILNKLSSIFISEMLIRCLLEAKKIN